MADQESSIKYHDASRSRRDQVIAIWNFFMVIDYISQVDLGLNKLLQIGGDGLVTGAIRNKAV